jgi:hypothetical protein
MTLKVNRRVHFCQVLNLCTKLLVLGGKKFTGFNSNSQLDTLATLIPVALTLEFMLLFGWRVLMYGL